MYVKQILLTVLLLFFAVPFSQSRGIFGSYELMGKVYDSKGNLLRSQVISVYDGKETREIRSDENGNYAIKVLYGTACRSVKRGDSHRKATREMNTRKLIFSFKEERVEIHTNWKKGARERTIEKMLRFRSIK